MIRNKWYLVLESREVKKNKIVGVKRLGEKLLFWRDKTGNLSCFIDVCAHRGAELHDGKIVNGHLQCPFHGLEYNSDGKVVYIPANGVDALVNQNFRVTKYLTHEIDGFVFIYWGDQTENIPPPKFFEGLDKKYSRKTFTDPWGTHYSRCIENQLDVSHLPFIHKTTIGAGDRKVVDGPVIKWIDENHFHLFVYNRKEDHNPPKKPDQLPQDQVNKYRIEFIFPNIWQNFIFDKLRIVVGFVPIDQDNTLLYLRTYQKLFTLPPFSFLINTFFAFFNKIVLHQDRRIVLTQEPRITALKMDENLFQADLPIIKYRKRREELKNN